MEVKKIIEGMTAVEVAEVIDSNFKNQNKILEEDIAKQNSVIGVSEYKDFSEAEAVNVGDVRKYNGFLYECVEATSGAFDASKWKKSSFKAETEKKLSELGSKFVEGDYSFIKELYIDKSLYTGSNDIYLYAIYRDYVTESNPDARWIINFTNGRISGNLVCSVYATNNVENEHVLQIKSSGSYGDVNGYIVIDWNKLNVGLNQIDSKVTDLAFDLRNSPTIYSNINDKSLSIQLSDLNTKVGCIKSDTLFIQEDAVDINNAIKELYIDKSLYTGSEPIYLRTVYREYVNDIGRTRWIIQFNHGRSNDVVCQYYQYDDEPQDLILPLSSSGKFGDVFGYIIIDWTYFKVGELTFIDKELLDGVYNIKNSPLINSYIKSLKIEDWKEYPTINVIKKGYLPNSGNGFGLYADRVSNISYSVHPLILDVPNNVNPKCNAFISMLENEEGEINESSILHWFNLILTAKGYNRLWLCLGANCYTSISKRVDYENDYTSANGHIVQITDEEVESLGLLSNKAIIHYPVSWHNELMNSIDYKPYIKIYANNTVQDDTEGLLYFYEIDWRNQTAVELFKNMLSLVSEVMENTIQDVPIKHYISLMEISFINRWGEGNLTGFGTKIPEYEDLECLKSVVEHYKSSFPDILLTAPALSMSNSNNLYNDNMKDFAVYLATTSGNNASEELGVFMDNVGFKSAETTTYALKYNGVSILEAIKNKRLNNKGIYVGELANTTGYWNFELKNDHLPYSIKKLGLSMFNHDIRPNDSYIIQTGINYIELMKDCYDKAGYRFYYIGNRSYYTRIGNQLSINIIIWIGNMGYSNLYHKFWKPFVVIRTDKGEFVGKISLSNLDFTKINHSDWNVGIEYATPYRRRGLTLDISNFASEEKFNLLLAIEDVYGLSNNMCIANTGRNEYGEYLIYNEGYNINYELNGGENSEFNEKKYYPCRESVKLYPAIKDGSIFVGWKLDDEFVTEIISSQMVGDITLVAEFRYASK